MSFALSSSLQQFQTNEIVNSLEKKERKREEEKTNVKFCPIIVMGWLCPTAA
jgi:hypothetical protein